MSSRLESVNMFSPLHWPEGKNSQEKCHALGRAVEWFFDLGQKSYAVHHDPCGKSIPTGKDKGARTTALKVISIIFKVLTFPTIIIPIIMLIGKLIYRKKNDFVVQGKVDPASINAHADRLLELHGSTNNKIVPDLIPHDTSIEKLANMQDEVSSVLAEVDQVSKNKQCLTPLKQQFLDAVRESLVSDRDRLAQFLAQADVKGQLIAQLQGLTQEASNELEALQNETLAWTNVQNEVFAGKDSIHKNLIEKSREFKNLIRPRPALENYVRLAKMCAWLPPNCLQLSKQITAELTPTGIINLGNSCYMNSILQILSASPEITQLLLDKRPKNPEIQNIVDSLRVFLLAHQSKDSKAIRLAAFNFRDALNAADFLQNIGVQHDAQEILERILGELGYPNLKIVAEKKFEIDGVKKTRDDSDESNFLQLAIENENGVISNTLQGLIDDFFVEKAIVNNPIRVIDNALGVVEVPNWQVKARLDEAPEVVLIQLMRFEGHTKGHTSKIDQQITIQPGEIVDLSNAKYRVEGVVQQRGDLNSGHYTANVVRGGVKYHCDDNSVTQSDTDFAQNGYLLLLKRLPE